MHKYIFCFKDKLLIQKLAKSISNYLGLQKFINTIQEIFGKDSTSKLNNIKLLFSGLQIRI